MNTSKNVDIMKDFQYSCLTDVGKKRIKNEDAVGFHIPKTTDVFDNYGALFIVADGVGGNSNGEIASKIAVDSIIRKYYQTPLSSRIQERLNIAIKTAHNAILEESIHLNTPNMATTVVIAVIFDDIAFFANVGDSSAYISGPFRENHLEQITVDHTVVEEQLNRGLITQKEALVAKNKNVITSSLGNSSNLKIDFFKVSLFEQDKILLTTNGLTHVVDDDQIQKILLTNSAESNAKDLVCLANSLGGPDNISLCVIQPPSMNKEVHLCCKAKKWKHKTLIYILLILLIVTSVMLILLSRVDDPTKNLSKKSIPHKSQLSITLKETTQQNSALKKGNLLLNRFFYTSFHGGLHEPG